MPNDKPVDEVPEEQVVVTFRQMERVLTGKEAVDNIQEAANMDNEASEKERASVMAAVGHVLNLLRKAEREAGALVLSTAQHGPASRLQSMVASGEMGKLKLDPLPTGGLEAKFDTGDWSGWAQVAWVKLKAIARGNHEILRPSSDKPQEFPDEGRIALLGDWATGLYGAPRIAETITRDADPYALLLHLGDVYYSGTEKEVASRFLNLWPSRQESISRAINSNHEMYSGGYPYFTQTLRKFEQESSYFALQNSHWTLVGLDVAYKDHDIDDEQVRWLKTILAQAGDRKVVLFSHHQLYSHFESQGQRLWKHREFGEILRSKRIFAWYWGHEHRCSIFEEPDARFGIRARCIGNSGMPQSRKRTKGLPQAAEQVYSMGDWRRSSARDVDGNSLPACVVLEGENPFIPGEESKFSPHSYAVLTLDGPTLKEQILSPVGDLLYENFLAP